MIKKAAFIIISMAMLFTCCGCQLAVEGGAAEPGTDALCGVFVTFEYLENQDYLDSVDWNAVLNGDRTSLNNQEAQRIYAVSKDDGTSTEYYFEGIEGLRLFGVFVPGDAENQGYNTSCIDDLLMERKVAYNHTDEGTEVTLEATLFVCPQVYGREFNCYCNPVYQTPDGRVYMTAGTGLGADLEGGGNMSQTLSGTAKKTVNGQEESRTGTVKLTVISIDYVEKYVLKEFDEQDNVICTVEIKKDSIPEEIIFSEDTAYAILQKHCTGADGKTYIERSFIDMSLDYMDVRFINEDGFAQAHVITLKNDPPNK